MSADLNAYEITYTDGTTETIADIEGYEIGDHFIRFFNASGCLVRGMNNDQVRAFGQVPNPEALVQEKYTYLVTLKDGSTKTVRADLLQLAVHGLDGEVQVYGFFTRVPDGVREELTVPYDSVQMIERVTEKETEAVCNTDVCNTETHMDNADCIPG